MDAVQFDNLGSQRSKDVFNDLYLRQARCRSLLKSFSSSSYGAVLDGLAIDAGKRRTYCRLAITLDPVCDLNDPLTAAVGREVLKIVERDNIPREAAERGQQLHAGLLELQQKYWCIGDIRGRGLLRVVEIISDKATKATGSDLGQAVSEVAMASGLSRNVANLPCMGRVFRLAPPVTVTAE